MLVAFSFKAFANCDFPILVMEVRCCILFLLLANRSVKQCRKQNPDERNAPLLSSLTGLKLALRSGAEDTALSVSRDVCDTSNCCVFRLHRSLIVIFFSDCLVVAPFRVSATFQQVESWLSVLKRDQWPLCMHTFFRQATSCWTRMAISSSPCPIFDLRLRQQHFLTFNGKKRQEVEHVGGSGHSA